MDEWFLYSLASCFMFSVWTITSELASRTIDGSTSLLLQLPLRVIVTSVTAYKRMKPGSKISIPSMANHLVNLNLFGFIFTIFAGTSSVVASFFMNDALDKGGSGSAVAVITGSYPALSYVLSVILGMETISPVKILGVLLAAGSCYCFSIAK